MYKLERLSTQIIHYTKYPYVTMCIRAYVPTLMSRSDHGYLILRVYVQEHRMVWKHFQ